MWLTFDLSGTHLLSHKKTIWAVKDKLSVNKRDWQKGLFFSSLQMMWMRWDHLGARWDPKACSGRKCATSRKTQQNILFLPLCVSRYPGLGSSKSSWTVNEGVKSTFKQKAFYYIPQFSFDWKAAVNVPLSARMCAPIFCVLLFFYCFSPVLTKRGL